MNYLIKGGEFNNKGAEAMTLVSLYNIRKHDPKAKIYILQVGPKCPFELRSEPIFLQVSPYFIEVETGNISPSTVKRIIKDWIKLFAPNKKSFAGKHFYTRKLLKTIDVVIDISGFALGSKWGEGAANHYINWINLLKSCGARVYLMPQSFGPFVFNQSLMQKICSSLKKCDHIFVREESGYQDLRKMGLTNATRMYDSVLIDDEYDPSAVIKNYESYLENYPVQAKHNVGIVPNARLFDRGSASRETMISFYTDIITSHIEDDYAYYLIPHAGEDVEICAEIKNRFSQNKNVIFIDHVMYSFNFERFAAKLDYIVASRYHSIVHAFRSGTPCAIIGWSDKYYEIAKAFSQEKYLIDSISPNLDTVMTIDASFDKERLIIKEKLTTIQEKACYSVVFDSLGEIDISKKSRDN